MFRANLKEREATFCPCASLPQQFNYKEPVLQHARAASFGAVLCLCFCLLWSLLVLTRCWGIGFLSLRLRLSAGCWFEWHSCAFAGQPPKAPSDYYLLSLINVHFLWPGAHARARSECIQPDPRCRKSINTIEVLISPPLWTICSFKSHLAEANLTFANEDLGSSR